LENLGGSANWRSCSSRKRSIKCQATRFEEVVAAAAVGEGILNVGDQVEDEDDGILSDVSQKSPLGCA